MNVSEEVKQKRAAKKAKHLSIWLSMENAKVIQHAMNRIRKLPRGAATRQQIVDVTLRKYTAVLEYHERKFNLQNVVGIFHAVARLIDASADPQAITEKHGLFIGELCKIVREQLQDLDGRAVCELLWALHKMRVGDVVNSVRSQPSTVIILEETDRDSLIQSILEHANKPEIAYNAQDRAILVHTLLKMQIADQQSILVQNLLAGAVKQISDFQPQDVSMLVWCLPQLKTAPPFARPAKGGTLFFRTRGDGRAVPPECAATFTWHQKGVPFDSGINEVLKRLLPRPPPPFASTTKGGTPCFQARGDGRAVPPECAATFTWHQKGVPCDSGINEV